MILPWDAIRSEIEQALALVRFEQEDGHASEWRRRAASIHLRAADLLMTGTPAAAIVGTRPKGN